MPDGRVAEWMLSLVQPREHAAALAGDLLEQASERGAIWFWVTVLRTMAAFLMRSVDWSALPMAMAAAFSWLVYIPVTVIINFLLTAVVTLVSGVAYSLTHAQTMRQLTLDILLIRFSWPSMPLIAEGTALFVLAVWGPFTVGRHVARAFAGRELLAGMVAAVVWPVLARVIPYLGRPMKAGTWAVPLLVLAVLAGAVRERRAALAIRLPEIS